MYGLFDRISLGPEDVIVFSSPFGDSVASYEVFKYGKLGVTYDGKYMGR